MEPTCHVCYEEYACDAQQTFLRPRFLPCGHTVCSGCLGKCKSQGIQIAECLKYTSQPKELVLQGDFCSLAAHSTVAPCVDAHYTLPTWRCILSTTHLKLCCKLWQVAVLPKGTPQPCEHRLLSGCQLFKVLITVKYLTVRTVSQAFHEQQRNGIAGQAGAAYPGEKLEHGSPCRASSTESSKSCVIHIQCDSTISVLKPAKPDCGLCLNKSDCVST